MLRIARLLMLLEQKILKEQMLLYPIPREIQMLKQMQEELISLSTPRLLLRNIASNLLLQKKDQT